VNYLLRGLVIPEGENTVEFRMEPRSYYMGEKISLGASILLIILLAGATYTWYKRKKLAQIK